MRLVCLGTNTHFSLVHFICISFTRYFYSIYGWSHNLYNNNGSSIQLLQYFYMLNPTREIPPVPIHFQPGQVHALDSEGNQYDMNSYQTLVHLPLAVWACACYLWCFYCSYRYSFAARRCRNSQYRITFV